MSKYVPVSWSKKFRSLSSPSDVLNSIDPSGRKPEEKDGKYENDKEKRMGRKEKHHQSYRNKIHSSSMIIKIYREYLCRLLSIILLCQMLLKHRTLDLSIEIRSKTHNHIVLHYYYRKLLRPWIFHSECPSAYLLVGQRNSDHSPAHLTYSAA